MKVQHMQAQNMPTRLRSEQTRERQTSINLPKMILLCMILFSLKEGMAEVVQKWCHTKNSASPKTKTNQKKPMRVKYQIFMKTQSKKLLFMVSITDSMMQVKFDFFNAHQYCSFCNVSY